jgi:hypothetical protein
MRAWIPCSAMLFAALIPATASAQARQGGGYYYGNTYISSEYNYPYAQTQDGYDPGYPMVTRPAERRTAAGYPYATGSVRGNAVVASRSSSYLIAAVSVPAPS